MGISDYSSIITFTRGQISAVIIVIIDNDVNNNHNTSINKQIFDIFTHFQMPTKKSLSRCILSSLHFAVMKKERR